MNIEKQAHLQLLNVIEPGSEFWCNEVKERGAIEVLASIKDGFYITKKQIEKIVSRLATIEIEKVVEEFRKNRGASIVVIDDRKKPIGRILADDLVDTLVRQREVKGVAQGSGVLS